MAKKTTPAKPKLNREQWLDAFAEHARPKFAELGSPLPKTVRASIGFTHGGRRAKAIGECWSAEASKDKHAEIFIQPRTQSDTRYVAGILTHELAHAATPGAGHKAPFAKLVKGLGMEGKPTHAVDGTVWWEWASKIIDEIGDFPAKSLDDSFSNGKKKQSTRMIKVSCDECDWHFRASQKNIDAMTDHTCLACGEGTLSTEE